METLDAKLLARLLQLARVRLAGRPDDLAALSIELAQPDGGDFLGRGFARQSRALQLTGFQIAVAMGEPESADGTLVKLIDEWIERRPRQITPLPPTEPKAPACGLQPDAAPKPEGDGKKWTPERIGEARAMRARLKREKVRDYAAQTAKAFGVNTARLRQVLGPDDTRPQPPTLSDWPPTSNRKHRAK